jgi:AGCS family alanine or glycine:cation symporter
MYYLKKVFKGSAIPTLVSILLCIYGTEIYQFSVMTNSLAVNLQLNKTAVVIPLLLIVVGASTSFCQKLRQHSQTLIPLFFVAYFSMTLVIILLNITELPAVIATIVSSAFTGHAAVGAFAGSSLIMTMSQGIRRGCYAGDVGVGYAAVVHSQGEDAVPERQASLAVFDIFLDSFIICTSSVVLVIITGVWKDPMDASLLIQMALSQYFPYMDVFMPAFILLLGLTTTATYFSFGLTCAEHLCPKIGRKIYYFVATCALLGFAYAETGHALLVMSLTAGTLLIINLFAIYKLRHEVSFKLPPEAHQRPQHVLMEPELSREIA